MLPSYIDQIPPHELSADAHATIDKMRTAAAQHHDLLTQLRCCQIELTQADPEYAKQLTERQFALLGRYGDGSGNNLLFPNRSVHVVAATQALLFRVKLPSVLIRIAQDPRVVDELRAGTAQVPQSGLLFGSAAEQAHTLMLTGSFLGPLLGCLMPYMWGYPCPRVMSTIIFGYGRAVSSLAAGIGISEQAQLLQRGGRSGRLSTPVIGAGACEAAIDWWTQRLDQLFRYLTDPATYIDSAGRYSPHEQLHWMLTFDQVLRLTTSLQTAVRDMSAQRVLAFTLLGSFADRLLIPRNGIEDLFKLSYARARFDEVKLAMPAEAAEILLPAAQRALDSLEALQKGFFIANQRNGGGVEIQMPNGPRRTYNFDDAVAKLMVVHRHATHGYGRGARPKSVASAEVNERILAHHDGAIPDDIALLPYLYLLAALSRPEHIRDHIIGHVEKI